jgi:hypothetical protein
VKSPSDASLSTNLIIDYINRFYINDVSARLQLFDLKTTYQFETVPGINSYNMPLYDVQTEPGSQNISFYPVYQGFLPRCSVNGVEMPFYTERQTFWRTFPNWLQPLNIAATGDGTAGPYTITVPAFPAIPGHVDMAGIIATGVNVDPPVAATLNTSIPVTSVTSRVFFTATGTTGQSMVVTDSGQFLSTNQAYGLLMIPGKAPLGNTAPSGGYSTTSNTINYATGVATVTFDAAVESGTNIQAQGYFYNQGIPRGLLYYNNTITVMPPPNLSYLIELDAYLSPAAFLNSADAITYGYMSEYLALGAARKILSDTGDVEQFNFYEPRFREQEKLVLVRSDRQFTATPTASFFSENRGSIGNGLGTVIGGW